ncbi:uncharacterized protein [Melanerpes formicivorus]|uniref:uncharacterized protein n=1 Tax=Melanerpes formicivorus TaxID=211600 RepID=UPI00358E7924
MPPDAPSDPRVNPAAPRLAQRSQGEPSASQSLPVLPGTAKFLSSPPRNTPFTASQSIPFSPTPFPVWEETGRGWKFLGESGSHTCSSWSQTWSPGRQLEAAGTQLGQNWESTGSTQLESVLEPWETTGSSRNPTGSNWETTGRAVGALTGKNNRLLTTEEQSDDKEELTAVNSLKCETEGRSPPCWRSSTCYGMKIIMESCISKEKTQLAAVVQECQGIA